MLKMLKMLKMLNVMASPFPKSKFSFSTGGLSRRI